MNLRHTVNVKTTETKPKSLKEMRNAKGLTSHAAAEALAPLLGRSTYDFSSVLKAESGDIFDARVLNAYAILYGESIETIMEAVGIDVKKDAGTSKDL